MPRDTPLILMLGASLKYPGGMTEVVRSYAAAGVFDAWPLRYVSTYEGRTFSAVIRKARVAEHFDGAVQQGQPPRRLHR